MVGRDRALDGARELLGGPAGEVAEEPPQPVLAEHLAVAARLGDPVRVEDERVPRSELGRVVVQADLGERAEEGAGPLGTSRAQATVEKRGSGPRSAMIDPLSRSSTTLGEGSSCARARMLWRASEVSAAASTPLPQTSPITATQDGPAAKRS